MDHATGRVAVTAQNHGFALEGEAGQRFDTPFGAAVVSHTCANDGVVEGVKIVDGRAFSVQYHPRPRPDRTTRSTCSTNSST